jgi:hypothetical protein
MNSPVIGESAGRFAGIAALLERARERYARRAAALRPHGTWHWVSVACVWAVALLWLLSWSRGNAAPLFDPLLQTNDARTAIFPFHRYAEGAPLADDPIAREMLEYQPYAYRLLFRLSVPLFGLLAAAKLVQGLLFLILIAAGVVLMTSRRAGLGAGLFFVFLFLHDTTVQGRVWGGLPRGFGFPTAALWIAGALAGRPWVRRSAALIAALTYPTALAMVLGAEGIYAVRGLHRPGFATLLRRLKHYAVLVVACSALLAPAVLVGMSDGGPIHTLEQAQREPAFRTRLELLPFVPPGRAFGAAFLGTFNRAGPSPLGVLDRHLGAYEPEIGVLITAVMLALLAFRVSATPTPAVAFLIACLVLYAASRVYAFRLYSPERYYTVGMRAAGLGLAAVAFGFVVPRWRFALRQRVRNFTAAGVIVLAWCLLGNGVQQPPMGLAADYRKEEPLWRFIQKLPQSSRIASHIMDGDNIPLFTARANNGAFETLQPWLTLSWARQKARSEDTLRALYAVRREDVLAYAKRYKVSHLLLNRRRYGADFAKNARSFEPFSSYATKLLRGIERDQLVLANVPDDAVVFRRGQWSLVSVAKLERAWERERAP